MSRRSTVSENAAKGRKKKQTDVITPLRRSTRLSNRYTRLNFQRSTLGQYGDDSYSIGSTSVLDESGQSVPFDFDYEDDIVRHDHSYSKGHTSSDITHSAFVPSTNIIDEAIRESTPSNLYGLDGTTEELGTLSHHSGDYDVYTRERILTPPKYQPKVEKGPSLCSRIVNNIIGFFYGIGSFIYILFAIFICYDIPIFYRSSNSLSRYVRGLFPSLAFLIILFGVVFITSTGPYVKYTPTNISLPLPPVIPVTSTVTEVVTPTPVVYPDQGLLDSLNALKADFDQYKKKQEQLIKLLEETDKDIIKNHTNEFLSLRGNFDSTVTDKVNKEKKNRNSLITDLKAAMLRKIEDEINNSSEAFDHKLQTVLEDNAKRAVEAGKMDETSVRYIAQGISDKAVSELRTLLEGMIGQMNGTLLAQTKSEQAAKLIQASEEWKNKLAQLEEKLSQQLADQHKSVDSLKDSIDGQKTAQKEDVNTLKDELNNLSIKITKIEKSIINLEMKEWTPPASSDGVTEETVLRIIQEALYNYSADQIAKFDFALESAGGHVVDSSDTFDPAKTKAQLFGFTLPITITRNFVGVVIQPAVLPGDCWCFKGTNGHVTIKLANSAIVNGVTIQHIPKVLSPVGEVASAVESFSVKGLTSADDEGTSLGTFEYNTEQPPIQTFDIKNKKDPFGFVRFDFNSNHGNSEYTCIYRLRVHGILSDK